MQLNNSSYKQILLTAEDIPVAGRLVSISSENVVADALLIWDHNLLNNQENINKQVRKELDILRADPGEIESALNKEISDRKAGDADLDNKINQEAKDRNAAIKKAIDDLIDGAPEAYDTLKEIADYIQLDKDAGAAIINLITNIKKDITDLSNRQPSNASTSTYGTVRLMESLDDNDANDVVTGGLLKSFIDRMNQCCDDVKNRLTELEKKEQIEVVVTPKTVSVLTGGTYQLVATVTGTDNKSVEWASSNTSVATVDQNGLVTAISSGTVTITATSIENDWVFDSSAITVNQKKDVSVSISPKEYAVDIDYYSSVRPFTATVSNAVNQSVVWSLSDTSIANVDPDGTINLRSTGDVNIIATSVEDSSKYDTATLHITSSHVNPQSITVNDVTVEVGDSRPATWLTFPSGATVSSTSYSISNTNIATISQSGIITGVTVGETTYTVMINGGITGTAKITVTEKPVLKKVFALSKSQDDIIWNLSGDTNVYGTESNPYAIKFGKDAGSSTIYVWSTIDDISSNWSSSIESKTAPFEQITMAPATGTNKLLIAISCASNSTTQSYETVYKFVQTDSGETIYLKVTQEPFVVITNFDTLLLSYKYDAGADLDTATYISLVDGKSNYWGFNGNGPNNSKYGLYIKFSGDDTSLSNGEESVLINFKDIINTGMSNGDISANKPTIDIDVYANWFGSKRVLITDQHPFPFELDHDGNDSAKTLVGTITDILVRTYSSNTFTEVLSSSSIKEWAPSDGNEELSSISVFNQNNTTINAADNLNSNDVKAYYTHAFTFRYDIASGSTTIIPGDVSKGLRSDFYVVIDGYDNYIVKYGNASVRDRDFYSKAPYTAHTTNDFIPITVTSIVYEAGLWVGRDFMFDVSYSNGDQAFDIYDANKNLLGTNYQNYNMVIKGSSEPIHLYIKLHSPLLNYQTNYYTAAMNISQKDSPELFKLLFMVAGTEKVKYYANPNPSTILIPSQKDQVKAVDVWSYKQTGNNYAFEPWWVSNKNATFFGLFEDKDATTSIEDGRHIETYTQDGLTDVPESTAYIKSLEENTSVYARESNANRLANQGVDNYSYTVILAGTLQINTQDGARYLASELDSYASSNMAYCINSLFYEDYLAKTYTAADFLSVIYNGETFTPTLKLEDTSELNKGTTVSIDGTKVLFTVPQNTEGSHSKVQIGIYKGDEQIAIYYFEINLNKK